MESAKSSISEDIVIIKRAFEEIEIKAYSNGDRCWWWCYFLHHRSLPLSLKRLSKSFVINFQEGDRILPGGYIYLLTLLEHSSYFENIGRIIAESFIGIRRLMPL